MLSSDQIVHFFKSSGISAFETNYTFDEDVDVTLKTEDINVFLQLVQDNSIHLVFYAFKYADIDDYAITDEDKSDADTFDGDTIYEKYCQSFEAQQKCFNSQLNRFDFSKPIALIIYCIMDGLQVGIIQSDPWDDLLPDKNEILTQLELELTKMYESAVEELQAQEQSKKQEVLSKLSEFLDTTDEWHACTNQRLRRNYCYKLIEKFESEYEVSLPTFEVTDVLEIKWNQYKQSKSK